MRLKAGVKLRSRNGSISQPMVLGIKIIESAYNSCGVGYCMATSIMDGVHGKASRHYWGDAVDFRTKHIARGKLSQLEDRCREYLGADFDVILESIDSDNEHLHVEYDPKDV